DMGRFDVDRSRDSARSQDRPIHRLSSAEGDKHPASICGQLDDAGHFLGGQQSRSVYLKARAAGLTRIELKSQRETTKKARLARDRAFFWRLIQLRQSRHLPANWIIEQAA